jgi:hypothetical protein
MTIQNSSRFKRKRFAASKNKRKIKNLVFDNIDFSGAANIVENQD